MVRDLQSRLRQLAWYFGNVDDDYGTPTTAAVRGFQAKRGSRSPGTSTGAPSTGCTR